MTDTYFAFPWRAMTYPTAVDAPHRIPVFHDDPVTWEEELEPPPWPIYTSKIDYEPDTWFCAVCDTLIGPRLSTDSEGIYDISIWTTCFRLTDRARLQTHPDIADTLRLCEECVPYEESTP